MDAQVTPKVKNSEDDSFIISDSNIVTGVGSGFLLFTGYTLVEIAGKNINEVFIKLLRLPQDILEEINCKSEVDCFLFTKSLDAREITISALQYPNDSKIIYSIKEVPFSRLNHKFNFVEHLYTQSYKGVCVMLADNLIFLRANQTFLNFFDEPYNQKDFSIGRSIHKICPNFTGSEFHTIWKNVLNTGKSIVKSEMAFIGFSRGTTYWDTSLIPIQENGKTKFIIHIAKDVTKEVTNRSLIEEQNIILKRQAFLLDISNEAIFAWNLNGTIIYWNKGAERMYGYNSEEAIGQVSHTLLKTLHTLEFSDIKYELETTGSWDGEIKHTCKNGRNILIDTHKQLIMDDEENRIVLETNRDISERKQQQEQLLKAEKEKNEALNLAIEMKNEFLSLISHEFKTPIAVINSAIQAMELICRDELSDKAKGFLNKIRQNSNRQLKLVNNLLDITRINTGHIRTQKKNIDIVLYTRSIVESITIFAQNKSIKLSFSSTLGKKVIGIDEEKYERILLNLLSNAIKFTPEGKSISVKLFQKIVSKKCKVCIQVSDKGIGIPDDKKEIIFERFGQVDNSLARQAEGTGIGLFLVKLLVELMDGEISLKSKVGTGSTFTIMFPANKANETHTEQILNEITDNRLIQATAVEFSDIYIK